MSNEEIRLALKIAFHAGENHEWAEYYDGVDESAYPNFDEWFEKVHGDIMGSGDISPVDEKTGTLTEIMDGAGNILDTVWKDENGPLY